MNADKKIEAVRPFIEFLFTLAIGILVFAVLFPWIKHFGFPSVEKYNDLLPLHRYTAALTNSIFLYIAGCATVFVVGVLYQYFFSPSPNPSHPERGILSKSNSLPLAGGGREGAGAEGEKLSQYLRWLTDFIILICLAILVFKNDPAYFDYSAFLGAVNDVMLGKDILADVVVSYGFFNVYFVAEIFKLFQVQDYYTALSIIVSVLYVLGYGGIYIFFRAHTQKISLSAAFLFMILYIDFYCLHIPIHWTPQSTFLRFGSYLPVFFLLFFVDKKNERRRVPLQLTSVEKNDQLLRGISAPNSKQKIVEGALEWLFAGLTGVLCFWVVEYGAYILIALAGVAICRHVFNREVKEYKWPYRLARVFAVIAGIMVFLTVRIWLKYGHAPVWSDLFYFQKLYSQSGLAMTQLNSLGLWLVPVFIYAAAVYFCLKYPKDIRYADVWLFLSFFGLESFLYFVGKGGGFVLARVVVPAIILAAAFLSSIIRDDGRGHSRDRSLPIPYFVYVLIIGMCIIFSAVVKKEGRDASLLSLMSRNPKEFIESAKKSSLIKFLKNENNLKRFQFDVAVIRRLVAANEPLAILSKNDTLYYIYARRKSVFKNAFYPHFLTHTQIDEMVDTILRSDVRYLFMDNSPFQVYDNLVTKHNSHIFSRIGQHFSKRASLGFIDVYERTQ